MAYDGIFIRQTVNELKNSIIGARIIKILEPKKNTLEISLKTSSNIFVLKISTLPNCPFIILSNEKDKAPYHAPAFTMILKKYLSMGQILNITQLGLENDPILQRVYNQEYFENGYERIICFEIKNLTELGDIETYYLYIELMGKYSNVILCNNDNIIIDALKRSTDQKPNTKDVILEDITVRDIFPKAKYDPYPIMKGIYLNSYNKYISEKEKENYDNSLKKHLEDVENLNTNPCIIYDGNKSVDFYVFKPADEYLNNLRNPNIVYFKNTSDLLEQYYDEKASLSLFTIEKNSLQNIISNLIEKSIKKIDIKESDINKCKGLEKYKLYGELIQAYMYDKSKLQNDNLVCENYYDNNNPISIPIDKNISLVNQANKYFNKYNKLKRTIEKSLPVLEEEKLHLEHLYSIKEELEYINTEDDVKDIKREIEENFHIKNSKNINKNKNAKIKEPKITKYISSNNIEILLGKNNLQNEYLTFKLASNNDTWFHVKNATGSHVIVKCDIENLPKETIIEAASLAAFYSSKKSENKVEVDYTKKKELKKVKNREPGFCIYHTNKSIVVKPEILVKKV